MNVSRLPGFARFAAIAALSVVLASPAAAQPGRGGGGGQEEDPPSPLHQYVLDQTKEILDSVEAGAEVKPAIERARAVFDVAIAYGDIEDPQAIRDAALSLRLLEQLNAATSVARGPILQYLRANGPLARTLAFMVAPEDETDRVYWCLARIIDQYPVEAADLPALTTAICIVHDGRIHRPHSQPTNLDPAKVFDYMRAIPNAMIEYHTFPPEVLIYLANSRAPAPELSWAHSIANTEDSLGEHYFNIEYDYSYFRGLAEPRIVQKGYTLPNLLEVGGVCIDQAYYAEHIAKSVGVPSMTSVGRDGEMGHAWLGFLRRQGEGYDWDFTDGRYSSYTDVRGSVRDPQTERAVPEAAVKLCLRLIGLDRARVEEAVALVDAVRRFGELEGSKRYPPPLPEEVEGLAGLEPRPLNMDEILKTLEMALARAPGRRDAWYAVIPLAESGTMTLAQKRRWAEALLGYAKRDQPDFVLEILTPMFNSEPPESRIELWQWAMREFRQRPDLACRCMIEQASAYAEFDERTRALNLLEAAFNRFANDTAWSTDALWEAERMLREDERIREILPLYARAFRRIKRPSGAGAMFLAGSTYMRVGRRFQTLLQEAGDTRQAQRIGEQLDAFTGPPGPPEDR